MTILKPHGSVVSRKHLVFRASCPVKDARQPLLARIHGPLGSRSLAAARVNTPRIPFIPMSKVITMSSRSSHLPRAAPNSQPNSRPPSHYPFSRRFLGLRQPSTSRLPNHIDARLFHLLGSSCGVLPPVMFLRGLQPRTRSRRTFTIHHPRLVTIEEVPRVAKVLISSITCSLWTAR